MSEKARSEASTQGFLLGTESLSMYGGSKRARQLIQIAHKQEESAQPHKIRLTAEVVSKISEGPAYSTRSRGGTQPVQTTIHDFAAALSRNSQKNKQEVTSALKFVSSAIGNGDSADIVKLSVALGYVLESPAGHGPTKDVSYLDDIVLNFTPRLRKAARESAPAVVKVLQSQSPDLRELAKILLCEGMAGLLSNHGGSDTDFLFHAATKRKCQLTDAARVSGCLCLWHFIRDEMKNEELRKPRLQVLLHEERAWLSIKYGDAEHWRHFTADSSDVVVECEHSGGHARDRQQARVREAGEEGGLKPLSPQYWLGVLLQRFWTHALGRGFGRKTLSRWLKLMLELELEHGLGLGGSKQFVQSVHSTLQQLEGDCVPLLQALQIRQVEKRAKRGSAAEGEGEVSQEAMDAWDALSKVLPTEGKGVGKSSNRAVIDAAARVGDVASEVEAAVADRKSVV